MCITELGEVHATIAALSLPQLPPPPPAPLSRSACDRGPSPAQATNDTDSMYQRMTVQTFARWPAARTRSGEYCIGHLARLHRTIEIRTAHGKAYPLSRAAHYQLSIVGITSAKKSFHDEFMNREYDV